MKGTIKELRHWPTDHNGHPILKDTHDALLYAQLICDSHTRQRDLILFRGEIYTQLRIEREKKDRDLQVMMDLAVKAQFFREALEEAIRITGENFKGGNTNEG